MKPILQVPRNAFVQAESEQSALLIDARTYYRTLYRALERAENYACFTGWQFESNVPLLRGKDAEHATRPVDFLAFLNALCDERPDLTVYVLAWDFSIVYAKEREWMQAHKFNSANPRIRFEWDAHPIVGGSHHQKFAVIDGAVGFLGGIDVCDARWDDCDHRAEHPDRVNVGGDPCKPYHDVQAALTGPVVSSLADLFVERWRRASGEQLALSVPGARSRARYELMALSDGCADLICAEQVALSRTQVDPRGKPSLVGEVFSLFSDAIASAERLIYAETQYFTSRSVAKALTLRMRNPALPKLDIVVFMPRGADSNMEKLALEDTQETVLASLQRAAYEAGHEFRLLYPVARNAAGSDAATFIHSKILIVDDHLLTIGSPNFTERSMGLDTELAVSFQCRSEEDPLRACIRAIRTKLLAEHSGVDAREFELERGLCSKLDELMEHGATRLRRRQVNEAGPLGPMLADIFDPGERELTDAVLFASESPAEPEALDEWFARGIRELSAELRKSI